MGLLGLLGLSSFNQKQHQKIEESQEEKTGKNVNRGGAFLEKCRNSLSDSHGALFSKYLSS
jgi:hypothetical protein